MKIKEIFIKTKDKVLNMIFPNDIKCIFCDKDLPDNSFICKNCKSEDIFNDGTRCKICDTRIKEGNIICDNCKSLKKSFEKCFCPLNYDGKVRKAIIKFKSDGAIYLAKPFAKLIYDRLLKEDINFDIIIPVPSHKKTIKARGYNPAKVIADELSILTGKPIKDILLKNVITKNQKKLTFAQRQTNLENSMILTDLDIIKGKNILLVDDIITTGATLNACANLLYKSNKIYACGIARTNFYKYK